MSDPKRILVRGPNPVGDLVMATGSLSDLRRSYPDAHVTLLLKPGREAVVDGAGLYDEVMVDDSHEGVGAFFALARRIRDARFDLAVIYTHALRTAAVIRLAGVPRRVGYPKGGQSWFLTQRVPPVRREGSSKWKPRPMTEIYADLAAAAGVECGDGWPVLAVPDECEERYRQRRRDLGIDEGEELIGLVPGAAFGASKLWPPERLAEVADRLTERYGLRSMVFASPAEKPIVDALRSHMKTEPIDALSNPVGLDLLKPFVRDLRLMVTMDTGPRHYATAFRIPTLCIMGPTDPAWTDSCLDLQDVVRIDVDCGPCQLKTCPVDHRCMTGISPDDVLSRIQALDSRLQIFG